MEQQTAVEWLQEQYNQCPKWEQYLTEKDFKQAKDEEKYHHGLFLHWFVKHYETATIDGMFGFIDSMGNEVTVREIVEHYYNETYKKD